MYDPKESRSWYLLAVPLLVILFILSGVRTRQVSAAPDDRVEILAPILTATPVPAGTARIPLLSANQPQPLQLIQSPIPLTGPSMIDTRQLTVENWKLWPVLPVEISDEMRRLYQAGLRKGTNPRAFSVIGDCQTFPEVFLGVFDTNLRVLSLLPGPLRETTRNFSGSFSRPSPTVRDGLTAGAVLWNEWAKSYQRGQVCQPNETPLACELRINNPSIVFIHIGTHWEARNVRYLTLMIEQIKEHGAVPVMVTKADNREKDERINLQSVQVAHEQGIPVWNFWAAVQHTPNQGLQDGSDMYLNDEAIEIHRYSALEVLDLVWKSVK
jgi:hypothetical protein